MSEPVPKENSKPVAWKFYYYALSVWALWLIGWIKGVTGETNLPPLEPVARLVINGVLINLIVSYFLLLKDARASKPPAFFWLIFGSASVSLCALFPVFSGDLMEYLIRGRIYVLYGDNPYLHFPVEYPRDLLRPFSTWLTTPDAYGPVFLWIKSIPALLARNSIVGMIFAMKTLTLAGAVGLVYFFGRIVEASGAPDRKRNVLLLALNPLLIVLTAIDGFNDVLMMCFLMAALDCLFRKRLTLSVVLWTISLLIKYTVVLALPFMVIYAYRNCCTGAPMRRVVTLAGLAALAAGIVGVCFWPVWAGAQTFGNMFSVGSRFYSNSVPYLCRAALGCARLQVSEDHMRIFFGAAFILVYAVSLIRLARAPSATPQALLGGILAIFIALYACLSSPLVYNYLILALPWVLLLSLGRRRGVFANILYVSIGLFAYFKRIGLLMIIGAILLAAVSLWDWMRRSNFKRATPTTG